MKKQVAFGIRIVSVEGKDSELNQLNSFAKKLFDEFGDNALDEAIFDSANKRIILKARRFAWPPYCGPIEDIADNFFGDDIRIFDLDYSDEAIAEMMRY